MSSMKGIGSVGWAVLAALLSIGCMHKEQTDEPMIAQSFSPDGRLRYAIDPSRALVEVTVRATGERLAEVKVGRAPARLITAKDGTVYVSNRGSRSVSVISSRPWREVARIEVGVEPVGLAVSVDGRTLYVVNAGSVEQADAGNLMAVDTVTRQPQWQVPVGKDPRELKLVSDRTALVSRYLQAGAVEVDLRTREVRWVSADLHASR